MLSPVPRPDQADTVDRAVQFGSLREQTEAFQTMVMLNPVTAAIVDRLPPSACRTAG